MYYRNEHIRKIDLKGRVSFPKDFSTGKGGKGFVLMTSSTPGVYIGFHTSSKIFQDSVLNELSAIFSSSVHSDKDGRTILSQEQRNFLGLNKHESKQDLAFIGRGIVFHIMRADVWRDIQPMYKNLLNSKLEGLGILPPKYNKKG